MSDPFVLISPMGPEVSDPSQAVKAPTLGETFGAAFDRENLVVNMARKLREDLNPVEQGYNPWSDERIKGTRYEGEYPDRFTYSYSRKDTERIIADIEREEKDAKILSSSGVPGIIATTAAGISDPTIFLPGGVFYRSAKGGYNALRTGLSLSSAAAGQIALQETGLQLSQQTRSLEESAANIATGTLLTAFLGAGASKVLTAGERRVLEKALKENRDIIGGKPPLGPTAAGAAAADLRTGELKPLVPGFVSKAYDKATETLAKVPYVGGALETIAKVPEYLAVKSNPMLRMATSESTAARRAMLDLVTMPLETVDNALGMTSSKFGIPLELDVKLTLHEAQVDLFDASNTSFKDYRYGRDNVAFPAARSYLEKKFGKTDQLDFDQFMAEVDSALRNGDVHPIPQVQQLAARFRKHLDMIKDLAKEQGIEIGDDVLGAISFAPRVYDRVAITRDRPEFIKRYTDWRTRDEAQKEAIQYDLQKAWDRAKAHKPKPAKKGEPAKVPDGPDPMDEVQRLLNLWQGKTAKEAQLAMAKRVGKSIDAGTQAAIETAVEKILARSPKSSDELVAEAEQTINQILSTPDGRLPKDEPGTVGGFSKQDDLGDLRGSLNARKLPMPDNDLLPFLVRNPLDYTMHYLKQGLTDLGMVARFGDTEGTQALKQIADDYAALMRNAKTPKAREKLQKAMDADIRDFAAMRDRIKGTYGFSSDSFMQNAGRVAESLKSFNVATLGGGFGLAQFPDFAGTVFRFGFMSALKDAWLPFFNKLPRITDGGLRAVAGEWQAIGIGAESWLQTRSFDGMGMGGIHANRTPFETTLRRTSEAVISMSGMNSLTDIQKIMASSAAGNNVLRWSKALANGKATQKQITALAAGGIDEEMAGRIIAAFENNGGVVSDGAMMPNVSDWTDKVAARRYQAAVLRDVEIAVLTPGQEKPLFLSNQIMSLFGQFKTFIAAANTRVLLANLQRRDANALSGLITHIGLGMLSYAAYKTAKGEALSEDPQDWIKEGVDRSGVLGWFGELNSMSAKATGGQADLFRLIGADKPLSRYASRGLVGNLLGPTYGKATDLSQITYAAANGQWTESDIRKLRQMIPFQNLFYLRQMFDQVEQNANSVFGIPARAE